MSFRHGIQSRTGVVPRLNKNYHSFLFKTNITLIQSVYNLDPAFQSNKIRTKIDYKHKRRRHKLVRRTPLADKSPLELSVIVRAV